MVIFLFAKTEYSAPKVKGGKVYFSSKSMSVPVHSWQLQSREAWQRGIAEEKQSVHGRQEAAEQQAAHRADRAYLPVEWVEPTPRSGHLNPSIIQHRHNTSEKPTYDGDAFGGI